MAPGCIKIEWDALGRTKLDAPLQDKELCVVALADAIKMIMGFQGAGHVLVSPLAGPSLKVVGGG